MIFGVLSIVLVCIAAVLAFAGIAYLRIGKLATQGKRRLASDITPIGVKRMGQGMLALSALLFVISVAAVVL